MSWQDRPYYGDSDNEGRPELRLQFRRPSMLVTWLVIANVAVHVVHLIAANVSPFGFERLFGLSLYGILRLELWQLVTYMFVHDPHDIFHILFNMLMLYFVGSEIERGFGRRRFLQFYAICGLIGGLCYLLLGALSPRYYGLPLVGASGAVYGLLIAAMIFYPSMQLIFFVFPMPIRVFGGLMLGIFLFQMLSGSIENLGGDVCHLGGALAAVGVLSAWGVMPRVRFGSGTGVGPSRLGRWFRRFSNTERKRRRLIETEAEVDRILEKVHRDGVHSLTRRERNLLARATRLQRERDEELANRGRY